MWAVLLVLAGAVLALVAVIKSLGRQSVTEQQHVEPEQVCWGCLEGCLSAWLLGLTSLPTRLSLPLLPPAAAGASAGGGAPGSEQNAGGDAPAASWRASGGAWLGRGGVR